MFPKFFLFTVLSVCAFAAESATEQARRELSLAAQKEAEAERFLQLASHPAETPLADEAKHPLAPGTASHHRYFAAKLRKEAEFHRLRASQLQHAATHPGESAH